MSQSISEAILQFIRTVPLAEFDDGIFNALALQLFEYQVERNAIYRGVCEQAGVATERVLGWHEIPAVTTSAFKEVPLTCFPPHRALTVFHTSGTTQNRAGKHYFRTLDFYRAAMLRSFAAYCLPDQIAYSGFDAIPHPTEKIKGTNLNAPIRMYFLGPTLGYFPVSSLGYMFSGILGEFGDESSAVFFSPQGVDAPGLQRALESTSHEGKPVFILGTALALLECMEAFRQQGVTFKLPAGSRVLDTGGYKGHRREVSREEFQTRLCEIFGVSRGYLLNEYGMTELSSQFYESTLSGTPLRDERVNIKFMPPWVRVVAVHPENLKILPEGEKGLLRIFDLANVDSVMAVQTEDLGRAWKDRMEFIGRATGAELRGCSLLTESIVRRV